MEDKTNITPKLKKNNIMFAQSSWYKYYAGYSDKFVYNYLKKYAANFNNNPIVLDPWTGSGTTNLVSNYMGYLNYGFDINPVMVIISKAKQFNVNLINREYLSVIFTEENINSTEDVLLFKDDYLYTWFTNQTVTLVRRCEYLILKKLLKVETVTTLNSRDLNTISAEMSFYYMALFSTVKSFTKSLSCSNPTWIKCKNIKNKINITTIEFLDEFFRYILNIKNAFTPLPTIVSDIQLSDCKEFELPVNSIDIVITSPPYCTRIDYAISTIIELAIMGFNDNDITNLRNTMLGTPKINATESDVNQANFKSETVNKILNKINAHKSKAAKSYYFKTYIQYFYGLQNAIEHIDRVVKNNGLVMFVIQDSYFKDIYINLSKCVRELFEQLGYQHIETKSYNVVNNMRYINTNSRKYKKSTNTRERIVILRKGQ